MASYRDQFAKALQASSQESANDPIRKQLEAQLMQGPSAVQESAPMMGLIDHFTGSRLAQQIPKEESAKEKLSQLLQLRQGDQKQKLEGLKTLSNMENEDFDRNYKLSLLRSKLGKSNNLKATEVAKFNEPNQIYSVLDGLGKVINEKGDMFGPVSGRIASWNPLNYDGQTIDAQLRTARQVVGKYLEGGILKAEDEKKYEKMLPSLGDTPEVAAYKLKQVKDLINNRQLSDVNALKGAGFNTDPIAPKQKLDLSQIDPDSLTTEQLLALEGMY